MQGLWAAGRSIALEMLLLQMAPEGLSRADRFRCEKLQCGEVLCSHMRHFSWCEALPGRGGIGAGSGEMLREVGRPLPEEKPVTFP